MRIVRHEIIARHEVLNYRMPPVADAQLSPVVDFGFAVVLGDGHFRQGQQYVERGDGVGRLLDAPRLGRDALAQRHEEIVLQGLHALLRAEDFLFARSFSVGVM